MRMSEAIGKGTGLLAFGGIDRTGRDARLLLAHALGVEIDRLPLEITRDITDVEWDRYHGLLTRRLDREPVSRIIGRRAFWGRDFKITPDVLDPRPETEVLVAALLTMERPLRLLDLGTGSGALAVSLAAEFPEAEVTATDISPAALAVAGENARAHGLEARITFLEADWFDGVEAVFDLIVSNPPYVARDELAALAPEVREHDPLMALSDGGDGLGAYRRITAGARAHLAPGGRLMVEIGAGQGAAVQALFAEAGLEEIACLPDLDGRERAVTGRAPG